MEEEEIPQQEVEVMEEEQSGERSDDMEDEHVTPCENDRDEGQVKMASEGKRPPKTFTYDCLGTPAYYNVGHTNTIAFQSMPYGQNLTPWTYLAQQYEPVYSYVY